jgi:hypothetical protein
LEHVGEQTVVEGCQSWLMRQIAWQIMRDSIIVATIARIQP